MAERLAPFFQFRFGVFNPKHFIVAVFSDEARAEQAVAALRDAGFAPDDVRLISGQQVLSTELEYKNQKGALARLAGLFPAEEADAVKQYVEQAERGALFMAVKAPDQEQRTVVKDILAVHGAHTIRYYGENTITNL